MQTFTAAIFELKALEMSTGSGALAPGLRTVRQLLHQLEVELREVIEDLQPVELPGGELVKAIKDHVGRFEARYRIRCRVRIVGRQRALPRPVEDAGLLIVKEALGNVHLHSSASLANIEVHLLQRSVRIVVRDDGKGFDPTQIDDLSPHHLGISGMRRRAEAIGGSFSLETTPGHGTVIIANLPVSGPT